MTLKHASLIGAMLALASAGPTTRAATPTVTTILGTGVPGYSNTQVNNPYGIIFGPDGAVYFCDLDNQRIRRLDLKTNLVTTIAGSGEKGYRGDGGPATEASLNMPHEIQFDGGREPVHRRARQPCDSEGRGEDACHLDRGWHGCREGSAVTVAPA